MNPSDLLYSETHEWTLVSEQGGDIIATIGISAFAVEQLTDLVFMELPEVGRQVKAGETLGEIESVKAVSDLYSPVSGEVIEVNSQLPDSLETLSKDAYGQGWIARIKMSNPSEVDGLMDYASYQRQCSEDGA